jgi:transcriptional regulator GlxA family with amidase domain
MTRRISVLALDGVFDTGLGALLDTFTTARDLAGGPTLAVRVIGVRRRVDTGHGLAVPVEPIGQRPDVVVVAALACKTPEGLEVALARPDVTEAGALLRRWAAAGTLVCAACTGTFVLGEAGLLDGRRATTTWWLAPFFRRRFPAVELDDSQMVIDDAPLVTAGAALAHLDLALWIVRRRSPALASLTARYLIVDARPSQAAYAIPDHLAHADLLVERFDDWARRHLAEGFSIAAAARAAGTSERTLARRLRMVLGTSPLAYVQGLRVERAIHLLQTTDASVDEIATRVGYADGVTLRTLLRRRTGRGLRELRARVA